MLLSWAALCSEKPTQLSTNQWLATVLLPRTSLIVPHAHWVGKMWPPRLRLWGTGFYSHVLWIIPQPCCPSEGQHGAQPVPCKVLLHPSPPAPVRNGQPDPPTREAPASSPWDAERWHVWHQFLVAHSSPGRPLPQLGVLGGTCGAGPRCGPAMSQTTCSEARLHDSPAS